MIIDRNMFDAAPELVALIVLALIGQVTIEDGEKEGAKAALGGIGRGERSGFDEVEEEALDKVPAFLAIENRAG